jgi:Tol biopolymer transport system component
MGHCMRVIATVHPDGSGERHITKGAIDGSPAWSPDGKRVAFVRQYPVKPGSQLWVMKADETGFQDLANGLIGIARTDPRPDWLDDHRIAFAAQGSRLCQTRAWASSARSTSTGSASAPAGRSSKKSYP